MCEHRQNRSIYVSSSIGRSVHPFQSNILQAFWREREPHLQESKPIPPHTETDRDPTLLTVQTLKSTGDRKQT